MDTNELKATLLGLLNRQPFVPIRVDGGEGQLAVIDSPEWVKLERGFLTVDDGFGRKIQLTGPDVTRLVPLDDLPGENGGLSYREFRQAILPLRHADPFRPFVVELLDGRRLAVNRPAQFLFAGRYGVHIPGSRQKQTRVRLADVRSVNALALAGVA